MLVRRLRPRFRDDSATLSWADLDAQLKIAAGRFLNEFSNCLGWFAG
jgi:hypothetical protein